jgi:lipid-A-disaccharide synthase
MSDQWRESLYFLGFLSSLTFGLRMAFQWLYSEYLGKSTVTPTFWKLSLTGNVLLAFHAFIQLQFHVFIIQVGNGVIAWRNLNLMQPSQSRLRTRQALAVMAATLALGTLLFASQGLFTPHTWIRVPVTPWSNPEAHTVSWMWHVAGTIGIVLFNSRFWVQWWGAESAKQSSLGATFWWISLAGEILCFSYFMKIGDAVNFIGPLFALVPYVRNLALIYRKRQPIAE